MRFRYDDRCSIGNDEQCAICDHQGIPAGFAGIPDCRSDHQYFSDGDVHSGADTDFCTEDHCYIFVSGAPGTLDDEHDGGVYSTVMVQLQPVCA